MKDTDVAWLAGLMDGEGCIHLRPNNYCTSISARCELIMTHRPTVDRASAVINSVTGKKARRFYRKAHPNHLGKRPQFHVRVTRKKEICVLFDALIPHLTTKRLEALLVRDVARRSARTNKYTPTELDWSLMRLVGRLKRDDPAAIREAEELVERLGMEEQAKERSLSHLRVVPSRPMEQ